MGCLELEITLVLEQLEMELLKFLFFNSSDDWATACTNSAKILWTTTLTTPYVITADSTYQLNMKTTDSVSIDFDSGVVDEEC